MREARHVAVGHERCAAVLFDAWRMPAVLIGAVRHHHDPLRAPDPYRRLAAAVNLGEALAVRCDINLDPLADAEQADLLALLDLVPDELLQVQQQLPERLDALRLSLSGS